jgi:hypothetical protein
MVVYLDLLFLFNFLINCLFLIVIDTIYKAKLKLLKTVLGGVIGGVVVIIALFDVSLAIFFKIFGGMLIGLVGLENCKGKRNIIKYSSFYVLNLASVGLVEAFGIKTHPLLFCGFAVIVIIFYFESNKNLVIFTNGLKYNIIVTFVKTNLKLKGYLDTGNFSEYNNVPIIYINEKLLPADLDKDNYELVQIATVNTISFLKAYRPKECILYKNKEVIRLDVLVVFCNLTEYDCLLNVKMMI